MSEALFETIQTFVFMIEIVLYAGCFAVFTGKLYCRKDGYIKGAAMIFCLYAAFYIFRMNVLRVPVWLAPVLIFLCIIAAKPFVRGKRGKEFLLFTVVIWYCVQNLCFLVVNSFYDIICAAAVRNITSAERILTRVIAVYAGSAVMRVVLLAAAIFVLYGKINRHVSDISGKEAVYLLVTPIAGMLFGNMIMSILWAVKENTFFALYEQFPQSLWLVPAVSVLFYAGICFSIDAYGSMKELNEERKKTFAKEQSIAALKNRIEETEQFYETARRMKHEMRNHISVIRGLLANNNYEEADDYIEKISRETKSFEFSIKTGSAVTDVIINDAKKKAYQADIKYDVDFIFEDTMGIEAYDMGIVLNNLLSNALEACVKQKDGEKRISVSGKRKGKFYLLSVKNTHSGEVKFNEKTGLPLSSKKDEGLLHGIGLENVSRAAGRYLGSMDIKAADNIFCVTVMLQGEAKS